MIGEYIFLTVMTTLSKRLLTDVIRGVHKATGIRPFFKDGEGLTK
jgi:hypothetical protein